jgi:hypothetical protein
MQNPDFEIEFVRNDDGAITKIALRLNKDDEKGHNKVIAAELASEVVRADGPEDHSIQVEVDVHDLLTIPS